MSTITYSSIQLKDARSVVEEVIYHSTAEFGLEFEISTWGETLNFFNNKSRGVKVGTEDSKSSNTKDKNPYSVIEYVWEKPAKGVKGKARETLNSVKIDLRFFIPTTDSNEKEAIEYLREQMLWLKLWENAEDKNKAPRFGAKEHKELCSKYDLDCPKTEVVELEGRKKGEWKFEMKRTGRKEAFGGGKTSYKTKYEELLEFINKMGIQDDLARFLRGEEVDAVEFIEEEPPSPSPSPEVKSSPSPSPRPTPSPRSSPPPVKKMKKCMKCLNIECVC